ncbi:MAG TPA: response regulator transcription factor [Gemmatimonadales bacterium]|nr:response regulator transcription factor [Gemmatimonadales bacterium]
MSDASVTVCIADDHAVVREGIRRVLEGQPGVRVVGEAANGDQALAMVEQLAPEVLVADVAMPGRTGIAVAAELTRRGSSTRVLILSMHDGPEYQLAAQRAGARGYLLKDSAPAVLRRAVLDVQRGMQLFPSGLASATAASPLDRLTPREREVLTLIARGRTNREIAAEFSISPRTIETHRESLMAKLEIRTIAGLTKLALEEGLLGES